MKRKKKLRLISVLICLVMLITVMPVAPVSADSDAVIKSVLCGDEIAVGEKIKLLAEIPEFESGAELYLEDSLIASVEEKEADNTYLFEGIVPDNALLGNNTLSLKIDGVLADTAEVEVYKKTVQGSYNYDNDFTSSTQDSAEDIVELPSNEVSSNLSSSISNVTLTPQSDCKLYVGAVGTDLTMAGKYDDYNDNVSSPYFTPSFNNKTILTGLLELSFNVILSQDDANARVRFGTFKTTTNAKATVSKEYKVTSHDACDIYFNENLAVAGERIEANKKYNIKFVTNLDTKEYKIMLDDILCEYGSFNKTIFTQDMTLNNLRVTFSLMDSETTPVFYIDDIKATNYSVTRASFELLAPAKNSTVSLVKGLNIEAAVPADVETADIYVDGELLIAGLTPVNNFVEYSVASGSNISLGNKKIKFVAHTSNDVKVINSSFILVNHKVVKSEENTFAENTNKLSNSSPKSFTIKTIAESVVDTYSPISAVSKYVSCQYDESTWTGKSGSDLNVMTVEYEPDTNNAYVDGRVIYEQSVFFPTIEGIYLDFPVSGFHQNGIGKYYGQSDSSTGMYRNAAKLSWNLLHDGESSGYGVQIDEGKITINGENVGSIEANKLYKFKIVTDLEYKMAEFWIDDICYGREPIVVAPASKGYTYYTKDDEGKFIPHTSTADDIYTLYTVGMRIFVNRPSTVPAESTCVELAGIDGIKYYEELNAPEIDSMSYINNAGIETETTGFVPTDAKALVVSLSNRYSSASVTKDDVKLYVNGVDTEYDTVSYEDDKVTVNLNNETMKANDKISLTFASSMLLCDDVTPADVALTVDYYAGEDNLHINTSLNACGNSVLGTLEAVNADSSAKSVYVIVATYASGELKDIKVQDAQIDANGNIITDIALPKGAGDRSKIMVWNNLTGITPIIAAEELNISAQQ